jgi:multidrug efflux pump subunit AcrA (membrane-fusion protein)
VFIHAVDKREVEISQADWQIARLMDGTRSSQDLVAAAKGVGVQTSVEQVDRLIRRLLLHQIVTAETEPVEGSKVEADRDRSVAAEPTKASPKKATLPRSEASMKRDAPEKKKPASKPQPDAPLIAAPTPLPEQRKTSSAIGEEADRALAELARQVASELPPLDPPAAPPDAPIIRLVTPPAPEPAPDLGSRVAKAAPPSDPSRSSPVPIEPVKARNDWPDTSTELDLQVPSTALHERDPIAWDADRPGPAPSERPAESDDLEPSSSPESEEELLGLRPRFGRRERIGIAVGGVAAFLIVLGFVDRPLRLIEPVNIQAASRFDVSAEVSGVVVAMSKKVGDSVTAGEVIARLENADLTARVESLTKQLSETRDEIARIQSRTPTRDPAALKRLVIRRGAELEEAKAKLPSDAPNGRAAQATRADLDHKRRAFEVARVLFFRARAAQRIPELRAKEAALLESLRGAQEDLHRLEIKSPISGTVVSVETQKTAGAAIEGGHAILQVAKSDLMRAEILVPESELDAVEVGQPVLLKVRSHPSTDFTGKVDDIAAVASPISADRPSERVVRVGVFVKNERGLLWDGMSGYAQVDCGAKPLASHWFHPLLGWMRLRFFL